MDGKSSGFESCCLRYFVMFCGPDVADVDKVSRRANLFLVSATVSRLPKLFQLICHPLKFIVKLTAGFLTLNDIEWEAPCDVY